MSTRHGLWAKVTLKVIFLKNYVRSNQICEMLVLRSMDFEIFQMNLYLVKEYSRIHVWI